MSIQPSYIEEIDGEFHGIDNVENTYDQSTADHEATNGYDAQGHGNHNGGFYRDNSSNYSAEGSNRQENFSSSDTNSHDENNNSTLALVPRSNHEIGVESLPFSTQQQIEEERLRGDILRYLVGNSNGTYHYSAELRAIIHDVIGIPANTTQTGSKLITQYLLHVPALSKS
jgi:hypothetical protein